MAQLKRLFGKVFMKIFRLLYFLFMHFFNMKYFLFSNLKSFLNAILRNKKLAHQYN